MASALIRAGWGLGGAVARTQGGVITHGRTRNMSLLSKIKGEVEKNKGLQDTLKQLNEDKGVQAAKEAARQTKDSLKSATQGLGEKAAVGGSAIKGSLNEAAQSAAPIISSLKNTLADTDVAQEAKKAYEGSKAKDFVDQAQLGQKLRDGFKGAKRMASSVEEKVTEATSTGPVPEKPKEEVKLDTETMGLVVREQNSFEKSWEKFKGTGVGKGVVAASAAVGSAMSFVGEKIFKETDTGKVIRKLKAVDKDFNSIRFLQNLNDVEIPKLLDASISGDLPALKFMCTESLFAQLAATLEERTAHGITDNSKVLLLSDVEMYQAKVIESKPVIIVTFTVQQTNYLVDREGVPLEGCEEDDINNVFYIAAFRREKHKMTQAVEWKVMELAVRGIHKMI